jgi:RimJ/RimL family protein N-acetyltransferase
LRAAAAAALRTVVTVWVAMEVFLETERMLLRRFTLDDVENVLALDSDPSVRRFVEDGEPVNRDEIASMIENWMVYYERSETYGFWAAVEKHTGEFLGWFHFGRVREAHSTNLSSDTGSCLRLGEGGTRQRARER